MKSLKIAVTLLLVAGLVSAQGVDTEVVQNSAGTRVLRTRDRQWLWGFGPTTPSVFLSENVPLGAAFFNTSTGVVSVLGASGWTIPAAGSLAPGTTDSGCTSQLLLGDTAGDVNCGTPTLMADIYRKNLIWWTDFSNGVFTSTGGSPYQCAAISTGTAAYTTSAANRPGLLTISSSAGANTGYACGVALLSGLRLVGGEHFEAMFNTSRFTDVVQTIGFLDSITSGAIVDGAYLDIDATGLITGVTNNNTTPTVTSTSFQTVLATWYRGVVHVTSTSSVTFSLYSTTDVLLWTATLTATIPSGAGRELGAGFRLYHTGASALELGLYDWLFFSAPLAR